MKKFAVKFSGIYYVDAETEEEAKEKWCDADFGEGEHIDIDEVEDVTV